MAQFTLLDILAKVQGVKKSGNEYKARCPAHDDTNPSLSLTEKNGKVLLHCHAGCSQQAVLNALGMARNKRPQPKARTKLPRDKLVKIYDYTNADGTLVHQTLRYEPKAFSQCQPDPAKPGASLPHLRGITPVLYRLPEVLQAVAAGRTILICEGEKDADTAVELGYVATTCAMGAKKWRPSYSQTLHGADVIILPHQDTAGKAHALQVVPALTRVGCTIRVVNLPAKDLTEWVEAENTNLAPLLNVEPLTTLEYDTPATNGTTRDATLLDAQGILDQLNEAENPDASVVWDNLATLAQLAMADWSQFKTGCKAILQGGINLNDLEKARKEARRQRTKRGNVTATPETKPEIHITTEMENVVDAAQNAIIQHASDPALFHRAHGLVLISQGGSSPSALIRPPDAYVIVEATVAYLRERMAASATFLKYDIEHDNWLPALPPTWVPDTLKARQRWAFPPLEGLISSPTMRLDGSLLQTPGYDVATGLFLMLNNGHFPAIPNEPTQENAQDAIQALLEVFVDFPFQHECHRTAAVAAILSLVGRHAIKGSVPLFAVSATTRGSGKGLLVDTISIIATGRTAPRWPETSDDEEERKRLLTLALEGDSLVLIDNITQPLGSAPLDAALTAPTFKDRILGKNQSREAPMAAVFFATGNNVVYRGDTARRVFPINLAPEMEWPEEREDFAHPQLLSWLKGERPRLVSAALTILRAYHIAGRPKQPDIKQIGSYEEWNDLIRSALIWTGQPDPATGRLGLESESDTAYDELFTILNCWHACFQERAVTLREAVQDIGNYAQSTGPANKWNDLRDALGAFDPRYEGKGLNAKTIGNRLNKLQGRVINQRRLVRGTRVTTGFPWKVESVEVNRRADVSNVSDVTNVTNASRRQIYPPPTLEAHPTDLEGDGTHKVGGG